MSFESLGPANHLIFSSHLQSSPASGKLFQSWLCIRWPKYWSFSFTISPSSEYSWWFSFRIWLVWSPCSPRDSQESSPTPQLKASILQHSAFFMVQLSHPYMTTGKTIALTIWTFVVKVMSLLFNMLSRLVITFLPRSKRLFNFMVAVTICSDFGTPKNKVCHCFHCFTHLFVMKWQDQMPWSSFSECGVLSQLLHLLFHLHQEALQFLFSFS